MRSTLCDTQRHYAVVKLAATATAKTVAKGVAKYLFSFNARLCENVAVAIVVALANAHKRAPRTAVRFLS